MLLKFSKLSSRFFHVLDYYVKDTYWKLALIDVFCFEQSLYLYCLGAGGWWYFCCCSRRWKFVCIWQGKTQLSRDRLILVHLVIIDDSYFNLSIYFSFLSHFRAKMVLVILHSQLSKIKLIFLLLMHVTVRYLFWHTFDFLTKYRCG